MPCGRVSTPKNSKVISCENRCLKKVDAQKLSVTVLLSKFSLCHFYTSLYYTVTINDHSVKQKKVQQFMIMIIFCIFLIFGRFLSSWLPMYSFFEQINQLLNLIQPLQHNIKSNVFLGISSKLRFCLAFKINFQACFLINLSLLSLVLTRTNIDVETRDIWLIWRALQSSQQQVQYSLFNQRTRDNIMYHGGWATFKQWGKCKHVHTKTSIKNI